MNRKKTNRVSLRTKVSFKVRRDVDELFFMNLGHPVSVSMMKLFGGLGGFVYFDVLGQVRAPIEEQLSEVVLNQAIDMQLSAAAEERA